MPDNETTALHERVVTLEHWRIQLDIANARAEEQRKHLDQRFNDLDKKVDTMSSNLDSKVTKINDSLTWIVRLVLGFVILAVLAIALKSGVTIPGALK
ncbi:hypothetical protein [Rhizobium favelukesii]|uniref:Conserved protein n=1 Tax=Rhizobium favelukesii TaxID=348824 RepID=W6RFA2_9HYPH|nr:hypothetical protein [Rhizobium favelukesii]MCS0459327.1 hypothetical protein [Rhizobium favelukesii]CDM57373.1 putative conserved protein [Rhizobium favelukesii]